MNPKDLTEASAQVLNHGPKSSNATKKDERMNSSCTWFLKNIHSNDKWQLQPKKLLFSKLVQNGSGEMSCFPDDINYYWITDPFNVIVFSSSQKWNAKEVCNSESSYS